RAGLHRGAGPARRGARGDEGIYRGRRLGSSGYETSRPEPRSGRLLFGSGERSGMDAGVTELRAVEAGVTNMEEAARFYTDVWGLTPAGEADGARYFRGTG